jgi:hypothetical protein
MILQAMRAIAFRIFLVICLSRCVAAITISDEQAMAAGKRLWQNECGGRVDGLTSWNKGEDFASLGIGHFIWYPEGRRGPFEESFPRLVDYLRTQNVALPAWLRSGLACPWPTREAFAADFQGARMSELRALLARTVAQQARFAALRLQAALPTMLEAVPVAQRGAVRARFENVAAAPRGVYALVDYVNFKGEGVKPSERYRGDGWGLLQVLLAMRGEPRKDTATQDFADAADRVLTARVANSPPANGEARWLPGWRARVRTYAAP